MKRTFIVFDTKTPALIGAALSAVFPDFAATIQLEKFLHAIAETGHNGLTSLGVDLARACGNDVAYSSVNRSYRLGQPAPETVISISSEKPATWNVIFKIVDSAGEIAANLLATMANAAGSGMIIDCNGQEMTIDDALRSIAPETTAAA